MRFLNGRWRLAVFALFVAVQIVFVVGAVAREEYLLQSGTEIRIRTRPVDPWDVFRGQYVDLAYDIDDLTHLRHLRWLGSAGNTVYVILAEQEDGLWNPIDASRERESSTSRPDGTVVIRATVLRNELDFFWVEYRDIGRFYVPEGTIDPESRPVAVVVVSGDGTARLKGLEVDGQSWP